MYLDIRVIPVESLDLIGRIVVKVLLLTCVSPYVYDFKELCKLQFWSWRSCMYPGARAIAAAADS